MRKTVISFALILLFISSAKCQDIWRQINTANTGDNGLIGNFIYAFHKDADSVIWIGTAFGISLWDGTNWQSMTFNDGLLVDEVGDIEEDQSQNIWLSYGSYVVGVSRYDGEKLEHFSESDGLVNNKVNDIMVDLSGHIWFATDGGISVFDGENWTNHDATNGLPDTPINCLAQQSNGDVWIGTSGAGTYIFQNNSISSFSWEVNPTDAIRSIYIDENETVWVAGDQTYSYNGGWTLIDPFASGSFGVVWNIQGDANGEICFTTSEGVTILENDVFTYFNVADNLPSNNTFTSQYFGDSLWVGTEKGISLYTQGVWSAINTDDNVLISNDINSVFQDSDGNLWYTTTDGVSKFDGTTWTNYVFTDDGKELKWVSKGLQSSNGDLWFATVRGIFKFSQDNWTVFDFELDQMFSGWIIDVVEDHAQNLWFGGFNYLLKYDGSEWIHYTDTSGFQSNYVESLLVDSNGVLWIGSRAGISKFENNTFEHFISGEDFESSSQILGLLESKDGKIYAISTSAVLTFDNGSWTNDLVEGNLTGSFIDDSDQIWIGSIFHGLIKYSPNGSTNYSLEDGLSSQVVNSIYRTDDGVFMIGTNKGITAIAPVMDVSEPLVSVTGGLFNIEVETSGFTTPYSYSLDGINFSKDESALVGLVTKPEVLFITDAYDTVQFELCAEGCVITGIANEALEIGVFPNPTQGAVRLNLNQTITDLQVQLYDQRGKLISNQDLDITKELQFAIDQPSGLYIVKLISKDKTIGSFRLIKQN